MGKNGEISLALLLDFHLRLGPSLSMNECEKMIQRSLSLSISFSISSSSRQSLLQFCRFESQTPPPTPIRIQSQIRHCMAASRHLRDLQSQSGNKVCVDCPQKNRQWASVSYGVFMCLECSSKHHGLGVHISCVQSVTLNSWSEIQLKKMELRGNKKFNNFVSQYSVPKETDIVVKYNTNVTSIYRDRIQSLAEGKPWRDPPVVKESLNSNKNVGNSYSSKTPLSGKNGNSGGDAGWDNWDSFDDGGNGNNIMRNNIIGILGAPAVEGVRRRGQNPHKIYIRKRIKRIFSRGR